MIVFSGTSYLGLDQHPEFLRLVTAGLEKYGTHYGGSRRSPLAPAIYDEVETAITVWTSAPAALLVSSGTSAGQLVVRYLSSKQFQLHASPLVHPALTWPGYKQHFDWESWLLAKEDEENALLTDSINPLEVQWPAGLERLESGKATLVVDDSHLIGYYGDNAAGSWHQLKKCWRGELIVTASLGKALSIPAGVILGNEKTIAAMRNMIHFGGASPPNPAFLHAWLQAGEILQKQRIRLRKIVTQIHNWLEEYNHVTGLEHIPIIGLQNHNWIGSLSKKGILGSSFRYPGPTDKRYSRLILNAGHSDEDIQQLKRCLEELRAQD